jgi:hypothetical protein
MRDSNKRLDRLEGKLAPEGSHPGSAAGESKKSLVSARQLDPGICSVQQGHSSRLSQHRNIDSNQHP